MPGVVQLSQLLPQPGAGYHILCHDCANPGTVSFHGRESGDSGGPARARLWSEGLFHATSARLDLLGRQRVTFDRPKDECLGQVQIEPRSNTLRSKSNLQPSFYSVATAIGTTGLAGYYPSRTTAGSVAPNYKRPYSSASTSRS